MDKLLNEFTVGRPIAQTWEVLTDVERIAPCMPGATLEEIEGDTFRGVVKVKLGSISTAFKGQANFVERDDAAHRAVLKAEGRDTTGKGNASAMITAQLDSVDADTTKVVVETDLHITGKVAQFGRGIMGDVSKKLMNQFAANLNTMLDQQPAAAAPAKSSAASAEPAAKSSAASAEPAAKSSAALAEPAAKSSAASAEPAASSAAKGATEPAANEAPSAAPADRATGNGATTASAPTVRKIDGPAAAPIELSDVAGSAILKRLLPLVGGLVLLWVVVRRLRRR
jgi:carbon monoxide dehydrogenase subunit G